MLNRDTLTADLRTLGIVPGDTLYLRASLKAIGRVAGGLEESILGAFRDAVGPDGTLLVPAFNKIGTVFSREKTIVDADTVPYSGAVSKMFLRLPGAVRSTHPTHSFVAIGPRAEELLRGHDESAPCFQPIERLADVGGKMLLIGCNQDSPGFSTVHVAQFKLGLTQRHLVRFLQRAWLRKGGEVVSWRPRELPGCSASFDAFYPAYARDENLVIGRVGKAYSLLVPSTKAALTRDLEILRDRPTFSDCKRWGCLTCGLRTYQAWRIPLTLVVAVMRRLLSK